MKQINSDHGHDCKYHSVTFYNHEEYWIGGISEIIRNALEMNEAVVILCTPEHWTLVYNEFNKSSQFQDSIKSSQISYFEAGKILANLREVSGQLSPQKFNSIIIQDIYVNLSEKFSNINFYGEIVDILCSLGKNQEAEVLEGYWNNFLKSHEKCTLVCGYRQKNISSELENKKICDSHSNILIEEELPTNEAGTLKLIGSLKMKIEIQKIKNEYSTNAIQHYLNFYHFALEESSIVAITDVSGKIEYVNDMFTKISKYSASELIGKNHSILNSGEHSKEFFAEMWKELFQGNIWRGEIKNRAKDGSFYWVLTVIIPFKNSSNSIEKFIAIRHDITEFKDQVEKLHAAKKMSLLGEMSAKILHDTMNPLAVISGFSVLIKNAVESGMHEKILNYVDKIDSSVMRIKTLFGNLRENILNPVSVSLISNEVKEKILLSEIVDEAILFFQNDLRYQSLKYNIENKINASIEIRVVKFKIQQLFINLIVNAVDATRHLENKWIKIETQFTGTNLEIAFTDCGDGIPENIADKIFNPLFSTKKNSGGTGLGLDICKSIVEEHGGTIVVNKNSSNTQFLICFPLEIFVPGILKKVI